MQFKRSGYEIYTSTARTNMKFTPQQRELIKETRNKINKLKDEQTALYSNLLSELNMSERAEDWIFDYVYNNYGTIKKIESFLK